MNDERFDELTDAHRAAALELRATLRDSERVDTATSARLAQARSRAVSASVAAPARGWLWASGGLTATAVVAVAMLMRFGAPSGWRADLTEAPAAEAIEVLTDDVDADFYEDLDLYRWLEDGRA